jgi:hypothetical protein
MKTSLASNRRSIYLWLENPEKNIFDIFLNFYVDLGLDQFADLGIFASAIQRPNLRRKLRYMPKSIKETDN